MPPAALFPGHLLEMAFGESPGGGSTSSSALVVFWSRRDTLGRNYFVFLAPVRARYPFLEVRAYVINRKKPNYGGARFWLKNGRSPLVNAFVRTLHPEPAEAGLHRC